MEQNKTYKAGIFLAYEDKPMNIQLNTFENLEFNDIPLESPEYHRINYNLCIVDIDRIEPINEGDIVFNKITLKTFEAEFGGDHPDHLFKVLYCSEETLHKNGIEKIPMFMINKFISEYNKGIVLKYTAMQMSRNGQLLISHPFFNYDKIYNKEELVEKLIHLHDDLADRLTSGFVTLDEWLDRNI